MLYLYLSDVQEGGNMPSSLGCVVRRIGWFGLIMWTLSIIKGLEGQQEHSISIKILRLFSVLSIIFFSIMFFTEKK
jgi:hypothetical protein